MISANVNRVTMTYSIFNSVENASQVVKNVIEKEPIPASVQNVTTQREFFNTENVFAVKDITRIKKKITLVSNVIFHA
jgi:hypothetical protein